MSTIYGEGYVADKMRAEFYAWVQDQGCDTDGAWSAWQGCWNRRPAEGIKLCKDCRHYESAHSGDRCNVPGNVRQHLVSGITVWDRTPHQMRYEGLSCGTSGQLFEPI